MHLEELDDRVVDLVYECWEEHRMPMLLSRLGGKDRGEIARLAKEHAGSLGTYLNSRLSDQLKVIQHSTKPTVIGAIPAEAANEGDDDWDAMLDRTHSQSVGAAPRFHPAFWAAFRVPLDEFKRRFMSIQPPPHFRDLSDGEQPQNGYLEIERGYVAGPNGDVTDVQESALGWLEANDLDATMFISSEKQSQRQGGGDLLGQLLRALDNDERKRVSLPLDVIDKLRRHS